MLLWSAPKTIGLNRCEMPLLQGSRGEGDLLGWANPLSALLPLPGWQFRALLREMLRERLANRGAEASFPPKFLKLLVSALGLEPRTY